MVKSNYALLILNLGFPCVGAVTYDENLENFTDYFPNNTYPQGHYKIAAL